MTVWIKQGVSGDLRRPMRRCKGRLVTLYASQGLDFYITSKREGEHHPASCHYEGDALDFKRQGVAKDDVVKTAGPGFDVIEYDDERDIFHVEWDPR